MRKIIDILIGIYLLPLRLSRRLAIYIKGRIHQFDQHFIATVDVINRKFSDDTGVIIDIGAYDADSAIYFSKALPNHKIMAFEPNPIPFSRGVENSKGYKNIEIFNLGFSDVAGEVDFFLTTDYVSSSLFETRPNVDFGFKEVMKVKVETLDYFFEKIENVLLVKLDVQGAELKILKSGRNTLRKAKLVLTEMQNSETYKGGCKYYELDEVLRENGFIIYTIFTSYNNEGTQYFDALYINQYYM